MAYPGFEEVGVLDQTRAKRAQNFLATPPIYRPHPLIKAFLKVSYLTKKAVLGQGAVRNCCVGNEVWRPVSLLLVLAASHWFLFTVAVIELLSWLLCSELRGVLQLPELHARYATGSHCHDHNYAITDYCKVLFTVFLDLTLCYVVANIYIKVLYCNSIYLNICDMDWLVSITLYLLLYSS